MKHKEARSRRVQAQRKFAQGAYVPPNVVAVAAADNRRDAAQDARNVTINPMTATNLLDVVSMQGLHTHLQPVVLVERLRNRNLSPDPLPQIETVRPQPREIDNVRPIHKPAPHFKKQRDLKRLHGMSLRPRRSIDFNKLLTSTYTPLSKGTKRKLQSETSPRSKKKLYGNSYVNFSVEDNRPLFYLAKSSTPKEPQVVPSVQPRGATPEPVAGPSGLQKRGARAEGARIDSYYNMHKIHCWMNASLHSKSRRGRSQNLEQARIKNLEESKKKKLDRAKKQNIEKARDNNLETNETNNETSENNTEARENSLKEITDENLVETRLNNIQEAHVTRELRVENEQAREQSVEAIRKENIEKSREKNLEGVGKNVDKVKAENLDRAVAILREPRRKAIEEYRDDERRENVFVIIDEDINIILEDKISMPLQDQKPGSEDLEATAEENLEKPTPENIEPPTEESCADKYFEDEDELKIDDNILVPCIAKNWRSFQQVINAPKEVLDSRCQSCKQCERIGKLIKLSALLKTQVKVDLTGSDRMPQYKSAAQTEHDNASVLQEIDNAHLYMELLPKHPTIMMKLRIHQVHGKELLSACLIPRYDARTNEQELLLEEQEHLLDQLIETLTLSLKDSKNRKLTDTSINSSEGSDNEELALKRGEKELVNEQMLVVAKKRITKAMDMRARIEAEKEAEVARIEQEKREEISRIEAEKRNMEAEVSRFQAVVTRLEEAKVAERVRIREEVRAEIEANRRMMDEVDDMARVLEKEKDAKTMDPGQCSGPENNAPSTSSFPQTPEGGVLVDAPVYRPTEEEFQDPIAYYEKIWPEAVKYGICKIVPPPGWKPQCRIHDDIKFVVTNQYIARLFNRWGPAARELCAIKLCLQQQKVFFSRLPLLDGVEVNVPKLYHLVQRYGGLEIVINKKRWGKVAEDLNFSRSATTERKLDLIYVKYILPYDTLSHEERQDIMIKVEKAWNRKYQKLLDRATNPLHRQKRMRGVAESSDDDSEDEEVAAALNEAEDCIIRGPSMNRAKFKRIATTVHENVFGPGSESSNPPSIEQIEKQYWRHVVMGTEHMCVHSAAIDTGEEGLGFTKNKNDTYGRHPFNLKMISQHPGNMLRYLGSVLGLTVPTLHLGMLFSTSCWHKDPHALPWKEYQHKGRTRIWYGIPSQQTDNFRKAVETLCPTSCQNKELWLPTDIAMLPPRLLREHNVSLSRLTQEEGEFIVAFPKAYTCCISSSYTESESVYFAPVSWLKTLPEVFKEARESCEPTMFAMEELLYLIAKDPRAETSLLKVAQPIYDQMMRDEVTNRQMLQERGLPFKHQENQNVRRKRNTSAYNLQDECEYCRASLFLSVVKGLVGKNSALCLEHALQLLDTKKYKNFNLAQLEVRTFVSVKELTTVADDMKRRIETA